MKPPRHHSFHRLSAQRRGSMLLEVLIAMGIFAFGIIGLANCLEHTIQVVNANRRHYEIAAAALAKADPGWLAQIITRRIPLTRWQEALRHQDRDIKVVIDFEA